jgi:hypothetical protein
MEEKLFFEHETVKVTNSRFIVDGQTFAMNNITSVKALVKKPSRIGPVLLIIVGALLAFNAPPIGIIVALPGVIWLLLQKTVYHIMLHTSGGETSALKSYQRPYVDQVVGALNNAIVARG